MTCNHATESGTELFKTRGDVLRMWHFPFDGQHVHVLVTRSPHDPSRQLVEIFENNKCRDVYPFGGEHFENFYLETVHDEEWPDFNILYTTESTDELLQLSDHAVAKLRDLDQDEYYEVGSEMCDNDREARAELDDFPYAAPPTCCHPTSRFVAVDNVLYEL